MIEPTGGWRCKCGCGKRIPREVAVIATSRGKVPAYLDKRHRNAARARAGRAMRKASSAPPGSSTASPETDPEA